MAIYTIYMRSFAPWKEFGSLTKERFVVPTPFPSEGAIGGPFHGDGRGFSLETNNPKVTSRVNAKLDLQLPTGLGVRKSAWCDESSGPWMGVGLHKKAVGTPKATFDVSKTGDTVTAVIDYGAANPLVKGAPDIDADGIFNFNAGANQLTIVSTVTGDQFPACEAFIVDPKENKLFVGGFAPDNKEQILRLYGKMNKPKEVWFESEIVVTTDSSGNFISVMGGGSGSNSSGPACEGISMSTIEWNRRIMNSILMPSDAP